MNLGTIDIGTNTTLLLVAQVDAGGAVTVLDERAEITRLGRGIGNVSGSGSPGKLGDEGIEATLAALRTYAAIAQQHHATIAAIGTEGLRRAANADDFLRPAAAILGQPIEVIGGDREAALTFRATLESFPAEAAAGWLAVVDIGGGSTEIVLAHKNDVRFHTSLPLGSVRLTERYIHHDPVQSDERKTIEDEIGAALAPVPFPPIQSGTLEGFPNPPATDSARGKPALRPRETLTLVGVAGTVTTFAAMAMQMSSYDATRVHGFALTADALDEQLLRLGRSTQAQRERMVGLDPRRADVIFAGGLILRGIAQRADVAALRVSDRGIRWGLLFEMRDAARRA
ncbi:MAG TPA: Ppx/GppA family phosphatase [Polyangia bacterium]|nr:Ppx/GppA family phosphatase [Polyangia bacterium]